MFESPNVMMDIRGGWNLRVFNEFYAHKLINAKDDLNIIKKTKWTEETKACIFKIENDFLFSKKINFRKKRLETRFRYCFQPSRGFWAAFVAKKIKESGFLTPDAYAAGERRSYGLVTDTWIVTEALTDVKGGNEEQLTLGQDLSLLHEAGIFLRRFHEKGFIHGDMQFYNFYVQRGQIGVWDLDSVQIYGDKLAPKKKRMKDVGRMFSSFIQVVDFMNSGNDDSLEIKEYAEALGQGYGIKRGELLEDLKIKWLHTMKLRHSLKW